MLHEDQRLSLNDFFFNTPMYDKWSGFCGCVWRHAGHGILFDILVTKTLFISTWQPVKYTFSGGKHELLIHFLLFMFNWNNLNFYCAIFIIKNEMSANFKILNRIYTIYIFGVACWNNTFFKATLLKLIGQHTISGRVERITY